MQRRVPSLDKINALVGYEPQVTLDDLLRETIDYMRAQQGLSIEMPSPIR